MKEPLKKRLLLYLIISPVLFLLVWLNLRETVPVIIAVLLLVLFLTVSAVWEVLADRKRANELHDDVTDERNDARYSRFLDKHGFEPIKRRNIEKDLNDCYRSLFGYLMLILGPLLAAVCFMMTGENLETRVGIFVMGAVLFLYGLWKCSIPQVRSFLSWNADDIAEINASYMNGKKLTFRRGRDPVENSGINIGDTYIVYWCSKWVKAVKTEDITEAAARDDLHRYYGAAMYTGSRKRYFLDMKLTDGKTITVELGEFQVRLAEDELRHLISLSSMNNNYNKGE